MGYAVYEDAAARDRGVERWAGYGVPAECDVPDCHAVIDRGMGYRCDEQILYEVDLDTGDETETVTEGCGLHFCEVHLSPHSRHGDDITPKPDTYRWVAHLLTDESWAPWRAENPARVAELAAALR